MCDVRIFLGDKARHRTEHQNAKLLNVNTIALSILQFSLVVWIIQNQLAHMKN